ncbi:MAG: PAS domain S-box protein [Acidobacteria bacterium]|nr:PAS domain S-box protein [Acidobacteriota bacterium]
MQTFHIQFKLVALTILTALALTIGVLNWQDRSRWAEPTDGIRWEEHTQGLIAAEVEPSRSGARAGIRAGDRLLAIDGESVFSLKDLTNRLFGLGIGANPHYTMARMGTGERLQTIVAIEGREALTTTDGFRAVVALIYLLIGLYVLIRCRRDAHARHFYALCILSFTLYLYRYTTRLALLDYVVYGCSSLALLLLPASLLHFSLIFPTQNRRLQTKRGVVGLIYSVPLILGFVQMFWFTGRMARWGLPATLGTRVLIDQAQLAYFAIFVTLAAARFLHQEIMATDPVFRLQIRWISRSALLGILPFLVCYAIPYMIGWRPNAYMEGSMLSLGLIPLGFGYAIIKYRLMDVDLLFRKAVAYLITCTTVLGGYFLLVVLGGRLGEELAPESGFLPIAIAALATAYLFAPVRSKIQSKIDKLFFKDRFDYRASLLEFGKGLTSEIRLPRLAQVVAERVQQTFDISSVAVLMRSDTERDHYVMAGSVGLWSIVPNSVTAPKEMIGLELADYQRLIGEELQALGLAYLQPLKVQGRIIGLIGLGEKAHREFLSSADIELLEALAGYAAIALENARLYKSVEQRALECAQLQSYSENIIESINVGVVLISGSGAVTKCNGAFLELYGADRSEIIDRPLEGIFSVDFLKSVAGVAGERFWTQPKSAQVYKLVLDCPKRSDTIINLVINPLHNPGDGPQGVLMVFDDVTRRVALEAQLLQSEKLSSIGLLAAGVAHEINTPIAGISSYTQMLLRQVSEDDPRKELLSKIERQTFRASEIVNSLLNFSRLNGVEFSSVNLNTTLQEALALLEHQFNVHRIHMETNLDEDLPCIKGNRGKLLQVFVNLFLNARDAMPKGGILQIKTSVAEPFVVVEVSDTGMGIPEEHIKRIYDPFFTTKGSKGHGLGLAVSYGIIQEHSGRIFVDSRPGKGTHFTLKFPEG